MIPAWEDACPQPKLQPLSSGGQPLRHATSPLHPVWPSRSDAGLRSTDAKSSAGAMSLPASPPPQDVVPSSNPTQSKEPFIGVASLSRARLAEARRETEPDLSTLASRYPRRGDHFRKSRRRGIGRNHRPAS